ncbi:MAG: glycerol-3-phosphate dehydrogenase C-terminal domain-containing protein [Pirellulales bacterium]
MKVNLSGIAPARWCYEAVQHYVKNEWAVHLDDVMIRRSGWLHEKRSNDQLSQVADWMATASSWDSSTRDAELNRVGEIIRQQSMIV